MIVEFGYLHNVLTKKVIMGKLEFNIGVGDMFAVGFTTYATTRQKLNNLTDYINDNVY